MTQDTWKKQATSYSENLILGNSLRTYYNKKHEIVFCESSKVARPEFLKTIKRLSNKELIKNNKFKPSRRRTGGKNK